LFAALTPVEMTVFFSLARDDGVLFTAVEMTVVLGSRHFDWRRSRNGEISLRDLVTPVEMTGISSEAGMQKPYAGEAALP